MRKSKKRPPERIGSWDGFWDRETPDVHPCEHQGCREPGLYPAPRSPDNLRSYYWFCLDHVREYNKAWNYYAGMGEAEIEAQIRRDTVWQRPTWPLGARHFRTYHEGPEAWEDSFGFFGTGKSREDRRRDDPGPGELGSCEAEAWALAALELEPPVSIAAIKARYKELVKRYHPDANGGDTSAEEKLKRVNHAYSVLKDAWQT